MHAGAISKLLLVFASVWPRPFMTERLLMGLKESKQTNKQISQDLTEGTFWQ